MFRTFYIILDIFINCGWPFFSTTNIHHFNCDRFCLYSNILMRCDCNRLCLYSNMFECFVGVWMLCLFECFRACFLNLNALAVAILSDSFFECFLILPSLVNRNIYILCSPTEYCRCEVRIGGRDSNFQLRCIARCRCHRPWAMVSRWWVAQDHDGIGASDSCDKNLQQTSHMVFFA